jgi:hypothetical protein
MKITQAVPEPKLIAAVASHASKDLTLAKESIWKEGPL